MIAVRSILVKASFALGLSAALVPWGHAQIPALVAAVDSAFVQEDVHKVLAQAAEYIEMGLLGQSRLYSQRQAQRRLGQFFRDYPPQSFVWSTMHADDGHWFATGRYKAYNMLRVYAHWEQQASGWKLVNLQVFK